MTEIVHPFEIKLEEATRVYTILEKARCNLFSGWSPEKHQRAIKRNSKSGKFISVTSPTDKQRVLLNELGFMGARSNPSPALCIQKHDWWPSDIYAQSDEAQQIEMDLNWLNLGGYLSVEKMARLVEANKIPAGWQ